MLQSHESGLPNFLSMQYDPYYLKLVLNTPALGGFVLIKGVRPEVVVNTALNIFMSTPSLAYNKETNETLFLRQRPYLGREYSSDVKRRMPARMETELINKSTMILSEFRLPEHYYPVKGMSKAQLAKELPLASTKTLLVPIGRSAYLVSGLKELGFVNLGIIGGKHKLLMKGFSYV